MTEVQQKRFKMALVGNPNCGKTALFNAITGGHAKVGNYPGVTVERKEGSVVSPSGLIIDLLDLPGTYSLDPRTPDEEVTREVLFGEQKEEGVPEALIAVADATSLERSLALVIELRILNRPVILALNMMDLAKKRGLELDLEVLSRELGVPVVPTVATKKKGVAQLLVEAEKCQSLRGANQNLDGRLKFRKPDREEIHQRFAEVDRILCLCMIKASRPTHWTDRIDRVVLHPFWGSLLLILILGLVFQVIFTWAQIPMDALKSAVTWLGDRVGDGLAEGPLRSLIVDGMIAGVGSVLIFFADYSVISVYFNFRRFRLYGACRISNGSTDGACRASWASFYTSAIILCLRYSWYHGDSNY